MLYFLIVLIQSLSISLTAELIVIETNTVLTLMDLMNIEINHEMNITIGNDHTITLMNMKNHKKSIIVERKKIVKRNRPNMNIRNTKDNSKKNPENQL